MSEKNLDFMSEKGLEKYIFDPQNPRQCKVYQLLLNIMKKKNSCLMAPSFFFQIYEDKLVLPSKEQLWDVPENYDQLESTEKIQTYISQYSAEEFVELTEKYLDDNLMRIKKISKEHVFWRVAEVKNFYSDHDEYYDSGNFDIDSSNDENYDIEYNAYIVLRSYGKSAKEYFPSLSEKSPITKILYTEKIDYGTADYEYKYGNERFYSPEDDLPYKEVDHPESSYPWDSLILFFDQYTHNFIAKLTPKKSSVLIATLDYYQSSGIVLPNNTHPLLLQDRKHINLLLDILDRDLQKYKVQVEIDQDQEEKASYLDQVRIQNYFSIQDLVLEELADKKEIYLVGENGGGKTLLLQALLLSLRGGVESGVITDYIQSQQEKMQLTATDSEGMEYIFQPKIPQESYQNVFAYGAHRSQNDSDQKETFGYLTLFHPTQYLNNPVKWFLYLDHKQAKGEGDQISLESAKAMLRDLLEMDIDIDVSPDRVIFRERGTVVEFPQLSEGYKSMIIWVCDLVERLSKKQPEVKRLQDFYGVVLIDEIELHLHPKWKYMVVEKLRLWFPRIQFIISTHSPTILLGSSKDAVFYNVYKEQGITKVSQPLENIQNYMSNVLVTSPLFRLDTARAKNSDEENL